MEKWRKTDTDSRFGEKHTIDINIGLKKTQRSYKNICAIS